MSDEQGHRQFRMTPVVAAGRDYSFWSHIGYCLVVGTVVALSIAVPVAWYVDKVAEDWGRRDDDWHLVLQEPEDASKQDEVRNE